MANLTLSPEKNITTIITAIFDPTDIVELRPIPKNPDEKPQSVWIPASDITTAKILSAIKEKNLTDHMYFGANPRSAAGRGEIRSATDFDLLTIVGNMTLAGNLQISLAPGAASSLTSDETFVLLNATTLSGSFLDVADGARLITADGSGSFLVNYGSGAFPEQIVLSDFQTAPEPESILLLGFGALGISARGRWTRRC